MLRSALRLDTAVLIGVQRAFAGQPGVVRAARALSFAGEHGAAWLAVGLLGAAVDRDRRRDWLLGAAGVLSAHAAAVVVKRAVRRTRPDHPDVRVLAGTPSRLSFPSAHLASTTTAAAVYGTLLGSPLAAAVVPPMLVSRVVLGVHYPSDVLAGSALGAAVGVLVRRRLRRWAR
jgi:membrane-associated phospholipid phosphatase